MKDHKTLEALWTVEGDGDGSNGFQLSEAEHEDVALRDEQKTFGCRLLYKSCLNGRDK